MSATNDVQVARNALYIEVVLSDSLMLGSRDATYSMDGCKQDVGRCSMRISVIVGVAMTAALLYGGVAEAAGSNPCAANPCAAENSKPTPVNIRRPAGTYLAKGNRAELLKKGEKLWNDSSLSTNGFTCDTCHNNHATFSAGFALPYPHKVGMVKERLGISGEIYLDEMVQFCLVMPLASKPLPWSSRELAALTAYTAEMQRTFKQTAK